MEDKDFVGMYCCPICKEPIGIIMDNRFKKTLSKYQTIGPELCDKCKQKFTEENDVVIYEADENRLLGRYIVVNRDGFCNLNKETAEFIDKNRFILMNSIDFSHIMENFNENKNKS